MSETHFSDQKLNALLNLLNYNQQISLKQMQKSENEAARQQTEEFSDQIRSIGSWSFNQNLLYVIFLQKNKLIMISKKKRRNSRIFDQMAEFISTRNSLQCRSHHQKLLQKYGEVKNIISNFKKYITKEQYRNKFQELFGKDKHKQQTEKTCHQVKEQVLSEQEQSVFVKTQQNASIVVQPDIQGFQLLYSQYMAQLNSQLLQYPLFGYYYPNLQNFS